MLYCEEFACLFQIDASCEVTELTESDNRDEWVQSIENFAPDSNSTWTDDRDADNDAQDWAAKYAQNWATCNGSTSGNIERRNGEYLIYIFNKYEWSSSTSWKSCATIIEAGIFFYKFCDQPEAVQAN